MKVITSTSPRTRALVFIDAYTAAPNDADIELRVGRDDSGAAAVCISINDKNFALMSDEARIVADSMESALREFPNTPESRGLPNIIMGLRFAADKAEQTP